MISRLVISVVAGIVAFLACMLLGELFASVAVNFVQVLGDFLTRYASLIALLVALYTFFSGYRYVRRP